MRQKSWPFFAPCPDFLGEGGNFSVFGFEISKKIGIGSVSVSRFTKIRFPLQFRLAKKDRLTGFSVSVNRSFPRQDIRSCPY